MTLHGCSFRRHDSPYPAVVPQWPSAIGPRTPDTKVRSATRVEHIVAQNTRKIRRYTPEERQRAVALGREVGATDAARRLSIPVGSVSSWMWQSAQKGEATATAPPVVPDDDQADATATQPETRVAKIYSPSQRAQILEYAAKLGVTAASTKYGVSRWTIYSWQRQVARAAAGQGPSPTSGPDPANVAAQRDREILDEWERHPGLGPSQIKNQLRRKGIKISTNTVRQVMLDGGYRPPKPKPRRGHDRRYEAVRPNHIWHLDYLSRYIHRANTFSLILLDDCSRFVVGEGVDDAERADLVLETFERAVERHGKPERVVHDKGSAFWAWRGISRFTRLLEEMEVEQIPATKETNGKLEVFNANLQKELFDVHTFQSVAEMQRRLTSHLHWYNHRRTSHALGGLLVPADRYYGRVEEVRARIEAGVADESDPLGLNSRVLDLFRVVSAQGRTEIWLMGQRILPPG